ncbi:hypothetical protein CCP2SC5_290012 [Azospirillaceae bacterium]
MNADVALCERMLSLMISAVISTVISAVRRKGSKPSGASPFGTFVATSLVVAGLFAVIETTSSARAGQTEAASPSASNSGAAPTPTGAQVKTSGLPIPRFVSLRSNEANLRTGPGVKYPVEWVFRRKEMPVEITAEFDTWRRIRDWEGSEGWVHQSMLSGKRALVVMGETRSLHREASASSPIVARAEAGVIGKLLKCPGEWCEVNLNDYRGWMRKTDFWGVYNGEKVE